MPNTNNSIEKKIQEFKLQFQDAYTAFPETAEEFEQFLEQALKAIQEEERKKTLDELFDDLQKMKYDGGIERKGGYWHYFFEDTLWKRLTKFSKLSQPKEEGKCNCLGLIDKELGHDGECPMRDK